MLSIAAAHTHTHTYTVRPGRFCLIPICRVCMFGFGLVCFVCFGITHTDTLITYVYVQICFLCIINFPGRKTLRGRRPQRRHHRCHRRRRHRRHRIRLLRRRRRRHRCRRRNEATTFHAARADRRERRRGGSTGVSESLPFSVAGHTHHRRGRRRCPIIPNIMHLVFVLSSRARDGADWCSACWTNPA